MTGWKGDPAALHSPVAGEIAALTEKGTPVDGDWVVLEDSAASNVKKKAQLGNLPGGGGGGGAVPDWVTELDVRSGGADTDDDEFSTRRWPRHGRPLP